MLTSKSTTIDQGDILTFAGHQVAVITVHAAGDIAQADVSVDAAPSDVDYEDGEIIASPFGPLRIRAN